MSIIIIKMSEVSVLSSVSGIGFAELTKPLENTWPTKRSKLENNLFFSFFEKQISF